SVAPNAELAQKIISKDKPDLILLDIMMPGMDGYELCKKLKKNPETEDIPIIFVTAMAETEDLVKGFQLGGVDYIIKPFKDLEVLARIKTHLSLKKLLNEKSALIQKLDSLSRIDPLTGISNRRDILEVLNNEQSRYERYGKTYSVIMGDIDYFKKINDQYGHDTGDYILKGVANVLKNEIRKVDFIARWGGEEFQMILPETNLVGGANVAELMLKALWNERCEFFANKISVSMSFGVNCHTGEGMMLEDLLKIADDRLYKAKERGRNQVVSI
ncbi:MAG: diguanylate cyclase, partial [Nitrospinae bacterium]|nr:diguanylate cyclase [Nitrospinota bacterium]